MEQTKITNRNTLTFEEKIKLASYLANSNSETLLESLGLPLDRSGSIACSCPVHDSDNPTAFSYCPKRQVWKCWTAGCHETYGSGLLGLICGIKQWKMHQAIDHVLDIFWDKTSMIDLSQVDTGNFIRQKKQESPQNHISGQQYNSADIEKLNHEVPYFLGRGYDSKTLNKFLAFECKKQQNKMFGRACIPLFNNNNNIVGFTGRIIDDNKINKFCPKWRHYPYDLPKQSLLYGFNIAKKSIEKSKTVALTEGPLDVWRLHENDVDIAVALLGIYISPQQINLLLESGVTTIIPLFDPDKGGIKALEYLNNHASQYFYIDDSIFTELTKDPGEMNKEEILGIIKNPIDKIVGKNIQRYSI